MDSEITRQEIISDDALKAPLTLAENFKTAVKELDIVISKAKDHQKIIGDTKSTKKLTDETTKLVKEQQGLVKVQSDVTKKLAESAQAASKDTNEIKKNTDAKKESTKETKNSAEAMSVLDEKTGGFISRSKEMVKALALIAASPVILALAAIVTLLAAASSAVKTFFDTTGEGEDVLERQKAVWHQFFSTLKNGWADLGKSVTDFVGEGALKTLLTAILFKFSPAMAASFASTAGEAEKLANKVDKVTDEMILNIVTIAKTQKDANELVLKSQDDLNYSSDQRLAMLEKAVAITKEQSQKNIAFAKENADALLLQIGLEHGLTEASTRKLTQEKKFAIFKEEENRALAEAQANIINLEGEYYQEVKKNSAKIINLKQEMAKAAADAMSAVFNEQIAKAKEQANALYIAAQKEMDRRIILVEQEAVAGLKTKEEAEKDINSIKRTMADDLINAQIQGLEKLLMVEGLNEKEREEIEKKLYGLRVDLQKAYYDQIQQLPEITIHAYEKEIKFLSELEKQYSAFGSGISGLFHDMTEKRIQEIDAQEAYLQQSLENELEAAGDNELAKTKIKKKFDAQNAELERKKREEQRKAAIFDKATSATQAGIATALAVVRALATYPAPNFLLGALAGAAGAIQVAAILAKPIPQYAEGTLKAGGHKGGLAIVGEKGSELVVTPSGKLALSPDTPTLMDLPAGTEVIPHEETMARLALNQIAGEDSHTSDRSSYGFELMGRKIDSLNKTIKNKKELHINFSKEGAEATIKHAESRIKFLNDFYY
jgi:hypothetical protein